MRVLTFLLVLTSGLITPGMMLRAIAQVTSDSTTNTIVNSNGNNFTILNGIDKGNNLFHSFSNFSVPTGGSATFDLINTPNITTIFSRVTGGNVSQIDGLIRTFNSNNPVNLFLINPAGVVFGQNAALNIGGSFVGTTANSIKFADGVEFSGVNPGTPPLLTMSVPIGLQMGQNSGTIAIQNAGHAIQFRPFTPLDTRTSPPGLQVNPGQTLALIGNGLSATGGILSSVSGNIQLGSVQDGLIRFNPTLPGWGFDYAGIQNFADIDLSQKSLVNVSGLGGGSIQFHGENIRLTEGSVALLKNFGSQAAGQISINATEQFELGGITPNGSPASAISSETLRLGAGANIQVTARQLSFQDGGRLTAFTFGAGQSGSITVNATDSIEINGFLPASPITSSLIGVGNAGFGATGNSGFIHITTAHLRLLNSGSVSSLTFGTGAAGDVQVDATKSIDLIGVNPLTLVPSVITTGTFNAGNAGNLTINTARLSLRQGGAIGSSSPATGKAGNISIQASESILVSDMAPGSISSSRIASVSEILDPVTQSVFRLPPIPQSNSGSVTIATPLLQVQNGGRVTVKNEGTGNAGRIPQNPNQDVTSDVYDGLRLRSWSDIRDLSAFEKTGIVTAQIPQSPKAIIQATSWHRNPEGKIELVADKSPAQVQPTLTCAAITKN
ncbi:filamentous hemagglutinin N-terminal domain-containing protein [Nostoc sp. ChiQUE01b]|uniref:two-partner secretion domain-containing protein n=1 Tax=Nostoc sp. ChiQUE01b TaxID=3075376 RepID=UPI002AD4F765|nr:filamentous hemagglutinin N-terminal domain-containing protein [Nostoc sp. ChiQUE01b]MDZ8260531.1 filamentous hemagglutinin N-terminal domain-containing protein [Nostoc sp. ChiQUE01b]